MTDTTFNAIGTAVVPVPVSTPDSATLIALDAASATSDTRAGLQCRTLLKGDTLTRAIAEADATLPKLIENTDILLELGNSAVEGVNALYDRLTRESEPEKIPEVNDIVNGLYRNMKGLRSKYDPADPAVRKKYESYKGGIGRFFGKAKTLLDLLWADVLPARAKMDQVKKEVAEYQTKIRKNVAYYDLMYEANEAELQKLIYKIAVMEIMRDKLADMAKSVKVGNADLGDRGGEKQAALAEMANNLDIRAGDFKGRLWIAWSTAPQVRMARSVNITLASKLATLVNVTIPTMDGAIFAWSLLIKSGNAAKLAEDTARASNEALQAYASASAVVLPQIAKTASTPTLSLATVTAMAKGLEDASAGILAAYQQGAKARAELEQGIVQAQVSVRNSQAKLAEGIVDMIVDRSKESALQIETSVG